MHFSPLKCISLFNEKEFEDSQVYNAEKMEFRIIHKLFESILEILLWVLFFYVSIWNWMDSLMGSFAICSSEPYRSDML